MFKRAKVVMLPTNKKANSSLVIQKCIKRLSDVEIGELKITHRLLYSEEYFEEQHLYITSNDEIKEGDWYIDFDVNEIIQRRCKSNWNKFYSNCKKIIATTDNSLIKEYQIDSITDKETIIFLPKPSQSFIEKYIEEYNKGNIITDVLIEYDLFWNNRRYKEQPFPDEFASEKDRVYKLKISKDNTITIKKVKESWNREEVIDLLTNSDDYTVEFIGENGYVIDTDKWIEKNL